MKALVEEHFFSKSKTKKYSFPITCVLIPGFYAAGVFASPDIICDRIVSAGKVE
jgi:hypothetical protein